MLRTQDGSSLASGVGGNAVLRCIRVYRHLGTSHDFPFFLECEYITLYRKNN